MEAMAVEYLFGGIFFCPLVTWRLTGRGIHAASRLLVILALKRGAVEPLAVVKDFDAIKDGVIWLADYH